MNRFLSFLFLLLGVVPLMTSYEEMVVHLGTEVELLPIYISAPEANESGLSEKYLLQLAEILRFDFLYNGMTTVVNEKIKKNQRAFSDFAGWAKEGISYIISPEIKNKKFSAKIYLINSGQIKSIDGIVLSGDLAKDRKIIHQVSDTIFNALFGLQGVASTQVLYALKTQDPVTKKWTSSIYEADYDGANSRIVGGKGEYAINPKYVPSSHAFLYVSYKTGQPKIYFGNLLDDKTQRFSLLKGNQLLPAMSKQRDQIAFISDVTGNPDLFLQEFDPERGAIGKPRQIYAAYRATQGSPTFSPDGKRIAFVSNKDGSPRIYVINIPPPGMELKNIKAQLITRINRENTAPAWSPDGSKIAYCSNINGTRQIWLYDFASNSERQLTQGPKHKENPAWALDSLHLIFNTADVQEAELYLMNLNQPGAVKITSGPGEKYFPNWDSNGG